MKLIVRATLGLLMCSSFVLSTLVVQAGGVPIGGNVQITGAGLGRFGDADEPDVVAIGNNVYTVWKDDRDGNNASILFARSTDGGATWSANKQFGAPGSPGGICSVSEPHFSVQGQNRYVSQNELASSVALSANHRWMVYNTQGFCNTAAAGLYQPSNFCIVDLASNEENCLEGVDYNDADFAPSGNTLVFIADLTGENEVCST